MPKSFIIANMEKSVRLLFPEVKRMWYMIDPEMKEEYVVVEYRKKFVTQFEEREITGSFNVCVSCDSNVAMVDDVWRKLKERFA